MKGMENEAILGILLVIIVVIIVVAVVVLNVLNFGKSTSSSQSFEEFCLFWSQSNYSKDPVDIGSTQVSVDTMCSKFQPTTTETSKDICIKCCKKEIVC